MNRYNAVTRDETFSRFGTTNYSHRISKDVFNFYPMYDWLFADIWRANAKFEFDYNHLYDLYYQAGVPFKSMRVANPFHQCGVHSLKLYQALEPETWGSWWDESMGQTLRPFMEERKRWDIVERSYPKVILGSLTLNFYWILCRKKPEMYIVKVPIINGLLDENRWGITGKCRRGIENKLIGF